MSKPIQLNSRVGKDGVLTLRVPLAPADADADVRVTIERLPAVIDPAAWRGFLDLTYGSCAGLQLERHDQGAFEVREALE